MKKILKYIGLGFAAFCGFGILLGMIVGIFSDDEPTELPKTNDIAIEQQQTEKPVIEEIIEEEPEQPEEPEQQEEPIKETPAVAPIVAPIIVEEQPKAEEPPKVEEMPEVVDEPKEEQKPIVEEPQEKVYDFILNKNTHKYHKPSCQSIKTMSEKNKEYFTGTVSEVEARGFEPCENCH